MSGEWVDAPPIPGTFVVNIGKGIQLNIITYGTIRKQTYLCAYSTRDCHSRTSSSDVSSRLVASQRLHPAVLYPILPEHLFACLLEGHNVRACVTTSFTTGLLNMGTVNEEVMKFKEQRGGTSIPDCEYPAVVPTDTLANTLLFLH